MDFRLLGSIEVWDGARPVVLHGRKQRALLAVLLLHRREWLSSDVLVDALWGEDPPRTARAALQNYVAKLRRALGPEMLVSGEGGYELVVTDEQIDFGRFERLVGEARAADGEERVEKLEEALELWRGSPLADVAYEPFASPQAVRLEELRVGALEDLVDAELALGRGPELVEKLETLVAENPFRERFPAQLMLALYRAGRQVESLEVYRQTRRTLLEELGIEPGTALRELEQAILRHDDSLEPAVRLPDVSAGPVDERRKLVTVLFADVACAETLDPELLRETTGRALKRIRAALERHGAQIELRASDEVMAVFGVPHAHEDDALRAARAAIEMQAELASATDQPIEVRVGIESGEVLAGVDAAGHGFVSGGVVTVTKRLLQHADPGEPLAGETALRLLGEAVRSAPKANGPEGAAVIVGLAAGRASAGGVEEPPLVGRDTQLQALHDAFAATVEAGAARLFLLIGEPGIGKTRLAREFAEQLEGRATIARGRCLSYGQALTYWPLVEALRTLGEPAAPALELLVAGGATSPSQLAWSVRQALERSARKRPLLVLLEDLHWAEPALLDLLESFSELSEDAPILLLGMARPELLDQRRPGWSQTVSTLLLEPLTRADSESLLSQLDRPPAREAQERVLHVAAGNPLFLEELSAFVAEGGDDRELPPRIQVLLQARLDSLPESARRVVATAALEGIVFHRGALEALVPDELRAELPRELAMLTRSLVVRPWDAELEGEQAFRFRHQLIRDTAYGALPKTDRARLHEDFADWIEQHSAGRIELEDITAYHLEQAALVRRELVARDPALEQRAAEALAAAAERDRRRTDLRAAASFGRRALALLEQDDPRAPELELELGAMLVDLGHFDEAQPLLGRAEQNTRDPAVKAAIQIVRLHARFHYAPERGLTAAIRRECAHAIPLFEQRGDHRRLGRAWHALGDAEWGQLRAQACADAYEKAAAEAELAGDRSLRSRALGQRLGCLAHTRLTFTAAVEEAERLSEQFPGELAIEATAGLQRVFVALNDSRREEALALTLEFLPPFRRAGYPIWAGINTAMVGLQLLFGGDVADAERFVLAGIAELEQLNERLFRGIAKTYLAQVRLAQGLYGEALRLAEEAVRDSGPDDRRAAIAVESVRARAHAALGEIDQARAAAVTAVRIANATDAFQVQAVAHYTLAETLAAAGDTTNAISAAEEAVRLWTRLDRKPLRRRAAALAQRLKHETEAVAAPTQT